MHVLLQSQLRHLSHFIFFPSHLLQRRHSVSRLVFLHCLDGLITTVIYGFRQLNYASNWIEKFIRQSEILNGSIHGNNCSLVVSSPLTPLATRNTRSLPSSTTVSLSFEVYLIRHQNRVLIELRRGERGGGVKSWQVNLL